MFAAGLCRMNTVRRIGVRCNCIRRAKCVRCDFWRRYDLYRRELYKKYATTIAVMMFTKPMWRMNANASMVFVVSIIAIVLTWQSALNRSYLPHSPCALSFSLPLSPMLLIANVSCVFCCGAVRRPRLSIGCWRISLITPFSSLLSVFFCVMSHFIHCTSSSFCCLW